MIKVIRPGYIKETMCTDCRSVLEYDVNEDVKEGFTASMKSTPIKYITCPICSKQIIVGRVIL